MNHNIPTRLLSVLLAFVFMLLSGINGVSLLVTDSFDFGQEARLHASVSNHSTFSLFVLCEETASESKSENSGLELLYASIVCLANDERFPFSLTEIATTKEGIQRFHSNHLPLYLSKGTLLI